ncbi:co-chaperone DjlA [Glaciecola siphonariae]|uniref:Co-chaperone protein DjlA n=1 Tax=Glaciecola siphonariae TaxID=521012 RepID=A0ABV9M0I9_9ALTE
MNYWGKIIGAIIGMAIFKLPGAILGLIVGHMFDVNYARDFSRQGGFARFFSSKENIQKQAVFFHALFSTLGHICKADGQVTPEEIKVASRLMDDMKLHGDVRKEAQQAFREGKERDFPLAKMLESFKQYAHGRRDILQVFLQILIAAACADGRVTSGEMRVLQTVAASLGFNAQDLQFLIATFEAGQRFRRGSGFHQRSQGGQQGFHQSYSAQTALADAYKILGVSESEDDKAIKRAYKKLMSQHHPDKLAAKGLPEQALEMANTRAQEIQGAYELIKEKRGI